MHIKIKILFAAELNLCVYLIKFHTRFPEYFLLRSCAASASNAQ